MFLNITNTGPIINSELADYIADTFTDVGYNQIYIVSTILDKDRQVDISYPGFDNTIPNTVCIRDENLNQDIINWLNTL